MKEKPLKLATRILIFIGAFLSSVCGICRQVTVPQSTVAALGDDVSLLCTSSETNPTFIWTYVTTGFLLYFGTQRATALGVHDNVVLEEATDEQTSILMINDIELEDEGDYRCGINTQTTFSSATLVSVEVASVAIEIDLIGIDDSANYQATCDAIGSKPVETITWILDGVVQSNGIVETDPGVSARPLFDKRSVFTFPASLDNYNVTLVCEIGGHQVSSLNRRETRRVDIQGRFAFFRIAPSNAYDIEIGGHHMFRCSPIDETWSVSWEKDDQPLEDALIILGYLILIDIQEEDEGKYTCVVRNPIGSTEARVDAWLQLSVSPQIDISDAITCPSYMPAIANAIGTPNKQIDINDTGTYMCEDNFTPSGTAQITCNNDNNQGVWGSTDFTCSPVECKTPVAPQNGRIVDDNKLQSQDSFPSGSNISFECDQGYRLVGSRFIICYNGEWSNVLPFCEREEICIGTTEAVCSNPPPAPPPAPSFCDRIVPGI